jgi:hypothetical protein
MKFLAWEDGPQLNRVISFDDKDVRPFLPRLDSLGGDDNCVGLNGEGEDDFNELSWPEMFLLIGKDSLDLNRSGGGVDRIIDEA